MSIFTCISSGTAYAAMPSDSTQKMSFYIGLQIVNFRFTGLGQTDEDGKALSYRRLMPTIGYQFGRRAKVEIGAIWRGKDIPEKMVAVIILMASYIDITIATTAE